VALARHLFSRSRSPSSDGRVLDALDSIPEGFALWDADDRLIACNRKYKEMFFPGNPDAVQRGAPFEDLVRRFAESKRGVQAHQDPEAWVTQRLRSHQQCGEPMEQQLSDGRWILSAEHRTLAGCVVSLHTDITKLKRAEAELEKAHQRLTFHVQNSPLAVIEWDRNLRLQRWSPQAERIFGWTAQEVLGKHPREWSFVHERDVGAVQATMTALRHGATPRTMSRNRNYTKDGRLLVCEWYNSALIDEGGALVSVLSLVQDVTESDYLSRELAYHATHDPLTGFVNRREFEARLTRALESTREDGKTHALCYLDLDNFKVINDSCGHLAGDEMLRQLGRVLPRVMGEHDTLARIGGDEFAVLVTECTVERARSIARGLRACIDEFRFPWEGKNFGIGVSIGVVPVRADSGTVADLLSTADAACYVAKATGGNRIHVHREGDEDTSRRRGEMQLVSRIRWALEQDRFELYFQPIVPVDRSERPERRYELLLRMHGDDRELVSPGGFLATAERYNLAPKLDRWVVSHAFAWLSAHPDHLRELAHCGINLSGHSLTDEYFLDFLIERFQETHIPPEKICFEITETTAVANLGAALHFMETLRGLGCRFALDDFGTGMSSFAYLRTLPVDFLKIDGTFVKNIATDPIDMAMVKTINELGQAMGKQTIAEFVENAAIFEKLKLRHMGVDFAQGYYIGQPQPLHTMRQLHAVR
jgi:diguanylate cyclase (GGDEF)-like protein/PAS domain S-box-containing protein